MNKIIFFFVFLIYGVSSYSQTDSIAICETGAWIIENWWLNPTTYTVEDSYRLYQVEGTIDFNGVTYNKLMARNLSDPVFSGYFGEPPVPLFSYSITSLPSFVLGFRNDYSKRAYCIFNDSVPEQLWYDFNLNIGDSLSDAIDHPYSYYETIPQIISDIDSIEFCGSKYRQYHFNDGYHMPNMVEQIGFTGDLIHDNFVYFEGGCTLKYFCDAPFSTASSYIVAETKALSLPQNDFIVFPNPTQGILTVETDKPINLIVTNITGGKMKTFVIDNSSQVNLSEFERGIYFLTEEKSGKTIRVVKE